MPTPLTLIAAGTALFLTGVMLFHQNISAMMSNLWTNGSPEVSAPDWDSNRQARYDELNQQLAAMKAAFDRRTEGLEDTDKAELWHPVAVRIERAAAALASSAPQSETAAETELRGAISKAGAIVTALEASTLKPV